MNSKVIGIIERIDREGMHAPYEHARTDGICDFNDGASFDACPYPEGSTRREVWQASWLIQRGYVAGLDRLGEIDQQYTTMRDLMIMYSAVKTRLVRAGGMAMKALNLTDDEAELSSKIEAVNAEITEAVRLFDEISPQLPCDDRKGLEAYVKAGRAALKAKGTLHERLRTTEALLDEAQAAFYKYDAAA